MGMFDYVDVDGPVDCPHCEKPITGRDWQTKDGDCMLDHLHWTQVHNFYTHCPHCNGWVEYIRDKVDKDVPRFAGYSLRSEY